MVISILLLNLWYFNWVRGSIITLSSLAKTLIIKKIVLFFFVVFVFHKDIFSLATFLCLIKWEFYLKLIKQNRLSSAFWLDFLSLITILTLLIIRTYNRSVMSTFEKWILFLACSILQRTNILRRVLFFLWYHIIFLLGC